MHYYNSHRCIKIHIRIIITALCADYIQPVCQITFLSTSPSAEWISKRQLAKIQRDSRNVGRAKSTVDIYLQSTTVCRFGKHANCRRKSRQRTTFIYSQNTESAFALFFAQQKTHSAYADLKCVSSLHYFHSSALNSYSLFPSVLKNNRIYMQHVHLPRNIYIYP